MPHQIAAFKYSFKKQHPILFMEMRLGKTLVVIRRAKLYKTPCRVLVVAPNSALGSWIDELNLENEKYIHLAGTTKERKRSLKKFVSGLNRTWFLINKEGFLYLPEIANKKWTAIVLDESVFIKNPRSKVTDFFISNFREVKHRWILTGTPNPENDLEFFCQMQFCLNEFAGCSSYWEFRHKYFYQFQEDFLWLPKKNAGKSINKEVGKHAFIQRRKDVNLDKKKIIENRYVELPQKLKTIYDRAEKLFILENLKGKIVKETIWATIKFLWLRRIAGGFLDGKCVCDAKAKEILELLQGELKKSNVVIWFNFNEELKHVTEFLKRKKIKVCSMQGSTKISQREKLKNAFNSRRYRVICIQQAIAQTGMNLSGADIAMYYSEPCGLMARKQTEDRILSLQKSGSLLFINLLTKNTVDEDIRKALIKKESKSNLALTEALKQSMLERRRKNG